MALPTHTKYLVIGAGIHGLSTAWHLAELLRQSGRGSGKDIVVVDERHGRLADRRTGHRPKVFALTGTGGDTMEVIGRASCRERV